MTMTPKTSILDCRAAIRSTNGLHNLAMICLMIVIVAITHAVDCGLSVPTTLATFVFTCGCIVAMYYMRVVGRVAQSRLSELEAIKNATPATILTSIRKLYRTE